MVFTSSMRYNQGCDLWSVGIILMELCLGHYSISTHKILNLSRNTVFEIFINSGYSIELQEFIRDCLNIKAISQKVLSHNYINSFSKFFIYL